MAKLKTHKAVAKRFKITKNKKVLKRRARQSHFNAKESGKVRRRKRKDLPLSCKTLSKTVKKLIIQN